MAVNFNGLPEIQRRLKEMLGEKGFSKATDKALNEGAKVVAKELAKRLEANYGEYSTGATVDEIVISKPKSKQGTRKVRIGWNGPKERYRLVHLNENGYDRNGKFYGPQLGGYKQIAKTIEDTKQVFVDTVKEGMKRQL